MGISKLLGYALANGQKGNERAPSLLTRLIENPEGFKLEAYIENEEMVIKLRRKTPETSVSIPDVSRNLQT